MRQHSQSLFLVVLSLLIPLGGLVISGCSKGETAAQGSEAGAPTRMGGPGGGRFEPVAATATAQEIFSQKCQGCHGDHGQGAMGPNLANAFKEPDANLYSTIHDGHGRMPAFGNQMTEAQIRELVAYVKKFKA